MGRMKEVAYIESGEAEYDEAGPRNYEISYEADRSAGYFDPRCMCIRIDGVFNDHPDCRIHGIPAGRMTIAQAT